jgi:hypothetical protein
MPNSTDTNEQTIIKLHIDFAFLISEMEPLLKKVNASQKNLCGSVLKPSKLEILVDGLDQSTIDRLDQIVKSKFGTSVCIKLSYECKILDRTDMEEMMIYLFKHFWL